LSWDEVTDALERASRGEPGVRVREEGESARAAGALNRLLARLDDVATRRQSELQTLQRALGRAERLAALGALVSTIAHELGTPLHSVAGHLDLMLADPSFPDALRERASIVVGEVDRLTALIRGHLERLRAPLPEPKPEDVNALVERIESLMRPVFAARGVDAALDLEEAAAKPWPCDAGQVEQVLLNLIQNALDAMPRGGALRVRTAVTESGRAISVSDTGHGLDAERVERAFEPFFTTKGAGHGTGLGLPLCREIARRHGGDIVMDSRPDAGTVVTLTLGEIGGER